MIRNRVGKYLADDNRATSRHTILRVRERARSRPARSIPGRPPGTRIARKSSLNMGRFASCFVRRLAAQCGRVRPEKTTHDRGHKFVESKPKISNSRSRRSLLRAQGIRSHLIGRKFFSAGLKLSHVIFPCRPRRYSNQMTRHRRSRGGVHCGRRQNSKSVALFAASACLPGNHVTH